MPEIAKHPDTAELAAFMAGRLPVARQQEVERHLEQCAVCGKALEALPPDTLAERLRGASHATFGAARGGPWLRDPTQLPIPVELQNHAKYRVLRAIGVGGMGVVYLAEHRIMQRQVALKVIHPELLVGKRAVKLFQSEVRAAAKLSHPNIVHALDAEQSGDLHFLVMEYLEGESLAAHVARVGPVDCATACRYIGQAAQGLQHAFEQGMVHRDIKPQNLLLTSAGQVKILDFGLARLAQDDGVRESAGATQGLRLSGTMFSQAGLLLGTPDYMAPEQSVNAGNVDGRADIYALGCTLYYLLRGEAPYPLGSVEQKLAAHREAPPPNLAGLRQPPPTGLAEVLGRMIAKRPDDRYGEPIDVARALHPYASTSSPAAPPISPVPPTARWVAQPVSPHNALPTIVARTQALAPAKPKKSAGSWSWVGASVASIAAIGWVTWQMRGGGEENLKVTAVVPTSPVSTGAKPAATVKPAIVSRPRVLILLAPNYQAADYDAVRQALERRGQAIVHVGSIAKCRPIDGPGSVVIEPDLLLPGAAPQANDYDALVIPGGYIQPFKDATPARDVVWRLIDDLLTAGKPVAAIGWGQGVLAMKGTLQGRTVAANPFIKQLMPTAMGSPAPGLVAVDGPLITAVDAAGAEQCAEELLSKWRRTTTGNR